MTQTCTLRNMTRRLVSVRCNSGRSRHLPPMASIEIDEIEVAGNAFVEKLRKRHVVSLTDTAGKAAKGSSAAGDKSQAVKKSAPDLSKLEVGRPSENKAEDATEASDEATGAAQTRRKSKKT